MVENILISTCFIVCNKVISLGALEPNGSLYFSSRDISSAPNGWLTDVFTFVLALSGLIQKGPQKELKSDFLLLLTPRGGITALSLSAVVFIL